MKTVPTRALSENAARTWAMVEERGGSMLLGADYVARQLCITPVEAESALDELVRAKKLLRRHKSWYSHKPIRGNSYLDALRSLDQTLAADTAG